MGGPHLQTLLRGHPHGKLAEARSVPPRRAIGRQELSVRAPEPVEYLSVLSRLAGYEVHHHPTFSGCNLRALSSARQRRPRALCASSPMSSCPTRTLFSGHSSPRPRQPTLRKFITLRAGSSVRAPAQMTVLSRPLMPWPHIKFYKTRPLHARLSRNLPPRRRVRGPPTDARAAPEHAAGRGDDVGAQGKPRRRGVLALRRRTRRRDGPRRHGRLCR